MQSAATLTIKNAAEMSPEGRKAVADWLRQSAEDLEKDGAQYNKRFTGHYVGRPRG